MPSFLENAVSGFVLVLFFSFSLRKMMSVLIIFQVRYTRNTLSTGISMSCWIFIECQSMINIMEGFTCTFVFCFLFSFFFFFVGKGMQRWLLTVIFLFFISPRMSLETLRDSVHKFIPLFYLFSLFYLSIISVVEKQCKDISS